MSEFECLDGEVREGILKAGREQLARNVGRLTEFNISVKKLVSLDIVKELLKLLAN